MDTLIQDLNTLERTFAHRLGKITESDAYTIIEKQDVSDEALKIALEIVSAEFHPAHAFIPQTYLRTEGIAGRFRTAAVRVKKGQN